mgnify:CR=1 FL=1
MKKNRPPGLLRVLFSVVDGGFVYCPLSEGGSGHLATPVYEGSHRKCRIRDLICRPGTAVRGCRRCATAGQRGFRLTGDIS